MLARRLLLPLLLVLVSSSSAEECLLRLRVVPHDVDVFFQGVPLVYDVKRRGYVIDEVTGEPPYQLELRKAGYNPLHVEVERPASDILELPRDAGQFLYLEAKSYAFFFHLFPPADLWLEIPSGWGNLGQTRYYLGQSANQVSLPYGVGADPSGRVTVTAEAFGYEDLQIQLSLEDMAHSEWPAGESRELKPVVPLISPILNWFSRHPGPAAFLLLLCLPAISIIIRLLLRGRPRPGGN